MKHQKILFLSAVCALTACTHTEPQTAFRHSVYVTEVTGGNERAVKSFAGTVVAGNSVNLGFKTPGQIKNIYVKDGERVREGQLLAELDNSDYLLGVEASQIQYDQVSEEVSRAKRLFEKKSMSANDYEKAAAGLRQLAVQLQVNKNKVAYSRLYAPADGVIESVNFSPAEMVDAGTAVFSLLAATGMEVECHIPAELYLQRDRFERFSCRGKHGDGKEFPLRLLGIVPKADGNQQYRLLFTLDGSTDRTITAGMNVEVSIAMAENAAEITVPASSVFRCGKEWCVWKLFPDSTVARQVIRISEKQPAGRISVCSGLQAGDRIVRAGVSALHEGDTVKIIEPASETNIGELL